MADFFRSFTPRELWSALAAAAGLATAPLLLAHESPARCVGDGPTLRGAYPGPIGALIPLSGLAGVLLATSVAVAFFIRRREDASNALGARVAPLVAGWAVVDTFFALVGAAFACGI